MGYMGILFTMPKAFLEAPIYKKDYSFGGSRLGSPDLGKDQLPTDL